MLYTFAHPSYDAMAFRQYSQAAGCDDALLFWQDGVWALIKYAAELQDCDGRIYVLQQDLQARNLNLDHLAPHLAVTALSLSEWVSLTERCFPQLAR
ncbi:tRNA 2-thiouridine synthesizing protein B [Pasteurella testudinis DSM 23072]|uniref:tRNA 2-thiouridine synthesizing protein B n=2 Tax=Pasteurella testudinis TaxID=761 RepID=A0A1W1USU6_9PAST|nr:sulfurtransferase complex subunit TusB [Pasteurella testudinis]SMB84182.1 tRNA 2-thiouridine synthesizing protein B [Pasteurella testudinis DSM 23072]SUB50883.1 tRNA 2-thiouridine synthesizing protein B [Pasteurella testudinis]